MPPMTVTSALLRLDVESVFGVVGRHYKDAGDYPPGGKAWNRALGRVAEGIA